VAVILLGGEHAHELTTAVAQVAEFQAVLVRQGTHDGSADLAEMSEDARINAVGLGQLTDALGEVADLASVDNDGGQAGGEQGTDRCLLIGAGRFEDDPLRLETSHPDNELFDAVGRVVETLFETGGSGMGVEEIFANIDTDEDTAHGKTSGIRARSQRVPTAFLFELVNAGLVPSDYSNSGAPIRERTQLTPVPRKSWRRTVSLPNGLVIHNPGFNG
jgi:hypothetical protein